MGAKQNKINRTSKVFAYGLFLIVRTEQNIENIAEKAYYLLTKTDSYQHCTSFAKIIKLNF